MSGADKPPREREEALFEGRSPIPKRPRCSGCKNEIDPDVCGCGEAIDGSTHDGHNPVPMGCDCYRDRPKIRSAAEEERINLAVKDRAEFLLKEVEYLDYTLFAGIGHGGVYLRARYLDADIYTNKIEEQLTRRWMLHPDMTDSEIISTAFKCCLTSAEHRAREAFMYKGARIYGPHFDVEDLVSLCRHREAAGGRKAK